MYKILRLINLIRHKLMSTLPISTASRLIWKKGFHTFRPCLIPGIFSNHHQYQNPCRFFSSSSSSSKDGENDDPDGANKSVKKPESAEAVDVKYTWKEDKFFTQDVAYGQKDNKGKGNPERPYFEPTKEEEIVEEEELLVPPTNCCRSGCPNCVWIDYVDKLSLRFTDPKLSREKILKDLETIDDESIKSFIMMELRCKKLI